METRAHHVVVGVFVLVVLAGVFAAVIWLGHLQFRREGEVYDIFVRGSVSGLAEGAAVRYKGVPIGHVLTIRLDPENVERIRVRIVVDTRTPIKQDAVASLELQGITGQAFVQISGGTNASPAVTAPPGHSYPVIESRPSQLEEVVMDAPQLLSRAIQVTDRLNLVLSDENRAALSQTLSNLNTISGTLARRSQDIDRIVVDMAATVSTLRSTAENADTAFERFAGKNGGVDRVATVLDDFDRSAKSLTQLSGQLDDLVAENRGSIRHFSQYGLNQTEQLITDARGLVNELSRIADQIERDPTRLLFGERREGYRPR